MGFLALADLLSAQATRTAGPIIQTYAGADWTFQGDGKSALNAAFGGADGIARDSAGNLYLADSQNYQVYRIAPDGVLTVIAGNGFDGVAQEGAVARKSPANRPRVVTACPDGSVLFGESFGVRRIARDATSSTFAGSTGRTGPFITTGGDGGPATRAGLSVPSGLACDASGTVYIADSANNRVRKVDTNGIITTIAGTGQAGFSGDGGAATAAMLSFPRGLRLDAAGNLFIADANNGRIRRVAKDGTIGTFAAQLNTPTDLDFDGSGIAYVTEGGTQRVTRITPGGAATPFAGTGAVGFLGDGGPASAARFYNPTGVLVDPAGNVLVADTQNRRVRRIDPTGRITTIAGNGQYRFSAEGTGATFAFLTGPSRVAVTPSGLVYIADGDEVTNRILRVEADGRLTTVLAKGAPGFSGAVDGMVFDSRGNLFFGDGGFLQRLTPDGTLTRYAGGGSDGGEGVAALTARILPKGLALDAAGTIYFADANTHRVRKVTAAGIVSTVAGTGVAGFAEGTAAKAQFNAPLGVTVDATGNVFVADFGNDRIRKIAPDGTVSTIVGPGGQGSCRGATDVTFDVSGALLALCSNLFRLMRVASDGTVTTLAGNGAIAFAGDGGPAILGSLNNPMGVTSDAKGNIYIADSSNFRVRVLPAAAPTLAATPQSLSFTARAGDAPPRPQQVAVSGSVTGLPYAVTSSAAFLLATPSSLSTPATLSVTANPGTLAPGSYTGTITLTPTVANVAPVVISVSLTLQTALPGQLSVDSAGLSFSFVRGNAAATRRIVVSNPGGGSETFSASARTVSGGSWLAVTPTSGSATGAAPVSLVVTANPAGLAPGTYSGSVIILDADGKSLVVPVTMSVSSSGQLIRLSQRGLTFQGVLSGGVTPPQVISVVNAGQGTFAYTARAITAAGIPQWLQVSPASGTVTAGQAAPDINVSVNLAGLAPGDYFGRIQVSSSTADNSPQEATVVFSVLAAGTDPGPVVQPAGLVFTGVAGAGDPASQSVIVSNLTPTPLSFGSGIATLDGRQYIQYQPSNALIPTGSVEIVVQPSFKALAAGIYRGAVTLVFFNGSIRTVAILIVIAPAGTVFNGPATLGRTFPEWTASSALTWSDLAVQPTVSSPGAWSDLAVRPTAPASSREITGCTPKQLLPLFTSLGTNFTVPASYPNSLTVKVVDDCGQLHVSGSTSVSFSNGDVPLALVSTGDGEWTGTWQSVNAAQASVTLTATAENQPAALKGSIQVSGGLGGNATPPLVGQGGVISGSSFARQAPLAPGSIVSIYGLRLSSGTQQAPQLPLGNELAGTQVIIGGRSAPLLFSSDGQVNAILPLATPVNTPVQMVVSRGNQISVPVEILIATAVPGVFSFNGSGAGQGHIYVAQANGTQRIADAANPARAGDTLVMYCSGLGPVDSAVTDGSAAPLDRLVRTLSPVTVSIGGVSVPASFAGLAPTFAVGLYQVNVVVPAGVSAGGSVPVTVTAAGQTSPTVTIAVR